MSKEETIKRYTFAIAGLFFAGIGVAFTKHAQLGVSPISSVANILSIRYDILSLGNWLIIWNCILLVGQVLILRKKFQKIQLLQIPLSFLFGYFTDFGLWLIRGIPAGVYPVRLMLVIIGIVILAFGITVTVTANVIMNSGEAFVKAISDTTGKNFGNVKIAFDISCVVGAVLLSFLFYGWHLYGTREGTIISALLVGVFVRIWMRILKPSITRMLMKHR